MISSILKLEKQSKYPYIGADKYGNVVLFIDECKGTRLKDSSECPGDPIGEFCYNWRESSFSPLEGSITLSNVLLNNLKS